MAIGYDRPPYVVPFDHRATFSKNMFGWKGPLSPEQTAESLKKTRALNEVARVSEWLERETATRHTRG